MQPSKKLFCRQIFHVLQWRAHPHRGTVRWKKTGSTNLAVFLVSTSILSSSSRESWMFYIQAENLHLWKPMYWDREHIIFRRSISWTTSLSTTRRGARIIIIIIIFTKIRRRTMWRKKKNKKQEVKKKKVKKGKKKRKRRKINRRRIWRRRLFLFLQK